MPLDWMGGGDFQDQLLLGLGGSRGQIKERKIGSGGNLVAWTLAKIII